MEPVFGNHLGMVVNNQDPEGRKRVQVFIPYLSNTLFSKWNNNLNDIKFKNTTELDKIGVLSRLRQTLPWAEAAAPIFGGATSMTSNSVTRNVTVNNNNNASFTDTFGYAAPTNDATPAKSTSLLTSNKTGDPAKQSEESSSASSNTIPYPKSLEEVPDNVLKYVYSLGASESGFPSTASVTKGDLAAINRESYGPNLLNGIDRSSVTYNNEVAKAYNDPKSDTYQNLEASQQKFGDFGPYQYNSENSKDAARYRVNLNYNAPANEQTLALAQYMYYKDEDLYKNLTNDSWDGTYSGKFGGLWGANRGSEIVNKRLAAYNNLNKDQMIANLNAISSDTALSSSASSLANNQQSKTNIIDPNNDAKNASAAAQSQHYTSSSGSPNGAISIPNESAKVWVFFYGGDIQKPVYFASAIEGST
jgi:hypothetical protein